MQVKDIASSIVLGLLFVSLVAIYLVTSQNVLVTGLCIMIVAICFIIARIGDWREIGVIGGLAAVVSLVAAYLVGQARFGGFGAILLPIVWGLVLLSVFGWISRNIQRVPNDRALILTRTYTGQVLNPMPPLAPPILPFLERLIATIPLYELSTDVKVQNVNTRGQHNINAIDVHVNYKVESREKAPLAMAGIPNRGLIQTNIAKEMGQDLDTARTNMLFWERLLDRQMQLEVDDVVREIIFEKISNPAEAYRRRDELELATRISERLDQLVRRWGVEITRLEIDNLEVSGDRFRDPERETQMERTKAEREATRIRLIRGAEAEAEGERVRRLIRSIREAGIDMSPELLEEIVVSAIQASSEWGLDVRYDPLLENPPQPAKKDTGPRK